MLVGESFSHFADTVLAAMHRSTVKLLSRGICLHVPIALMRPPYSSLGSSEVPFTRTERDVWRVGAPQQRRNRAIAKSAYYSGPVGASRKRAGQTSADSICELIMPRVQSDAPTDRATRHSPELAPFRRARSSEDSLRMRCSRRQLMSRWPLASFTRAG